jgi:hypothetical protein
VTEEGLVDVPRNHVERLEGAAQVVEIRPEEELPGAGARSGKPRQAIDQPNSVWDILDKEWKETAKSPLCVVAPVAGGGGVNSTRVDYSPGGREKIGKAGTGDPEVNAVNMLVEAGVYRDVALTRVRYAIDKLQKEGKELIGDDVVQGACEANHVFPEEPGAKSNPAA